MGADFQLAKTADFEMAIDSPGLEPPNFRPDRTRAAS
jgi:hypothetical protein